ncbi:pseudouridine synthase, partial [Paraphysoderma sedebokerense]
INQDSTHPEHILSPSNSISTLLYKIDPPVSAEHIRIVFQDHSVVVVDKPGSIPIHPNARYTHNSLVNILKYDYGISGLFPIHRLDALTTGTIIFARSPTLAKRLQKEMKSRNVVKKYLALVEGDFVRLVS